MLEKRVEQPRRETWRILDDRMQLGTPGSVGVREILLDQAPAVAALAQTLRRVMAGDLEALDKDFQLALSGDEREWTVQLDASPAGRRAPPETRSTCRAPDRACRTIVISEARAIARRRA